MAMPLVEAPMHGLRTSRLPTPWLYRMMRAPRSSHRSLLLLNALALVSVAMGQLDVPGPLLLDGSAPEQRQVLGLGSPQTSDAAVSLGDLRSATVSRSPVLGNTLLTADLFPPPPGYTPGMIVQLTPVQANSAGAEIDLNGLGVRPVVKWGGLPLDSADLRPGVPVRLVYDGERFLLLGDSRLNCPPGYVSVAADFCVETASRLGADLYDANLQCAASGGRLCTFAEWSHACRNVPDFMSTVLDLEWVDSAANSTNYGKVMGVGEDGSGGTGTGCTFGGLRLPTVVNRYRCCTNR